MRAAVRFALISVPFPSVQLTTSTFRNTVAQDARTLSSMHAPGVHAVRVFTSQWLLFMSMEAVLRLA